MASQVELPEWVNERTVENAYRRAKMAQHRRDLGFAEKGMRAARARDARLLRTLESATEVLHGIQERQHGRTMRDHSNPYSHRVELTEYTLWREAFKLADQGKPIQHFMWIYGAAAELAGL